MKKKVTLGQVSSSNLRWFFMLIMSSMMKDLNNWSDQILFVFKKHLTQCLQKKGNNLLKTQFSEFWYKYLYFLHSRMKFYQTYYILSDLDEQKRQMPILWTKMKQAGWTNSFSA